MCNTRNQHWLLEEKLLYLIVYGRDGGRGGRGGDGDDDDDDDVMIMFCDNNFNR